MTTRKELEDAIGEGIHTGFRKGTDHPNAATYWKMIDEMPAELWSDVLQFTVFGLVHMGLVEVEDD